MKGEPRNQLTSADAFGGFRISPKVALQPLGVVAGQALAAVFVQLFRAHLAASAAVKDQSNSWGASGYLQGTLAFERAG